MIKEVLTDTVQFVKANYKWILVAIVVLVVVNYLFKKYKKGKLKKRVSDNYTISYSQANDLIQRVIRDASLFSEDQGVYETLLSLSDADLAYVANVWIDAYSDEYGEDTLVEYIQNNNFYITDAMQLVINRLTSLA